MNPDLLYVQCDKCHSWYHIECIGVSKEEVEAIEKYFCTLCKSPVNLPLGELNLKKKGKKSNNKTSKQNTSQSLFKYFKSCKDNNSNSLQTEGINSNTIGFFNHLKKWNDPLFIGETQNSILCRTTTNTTSKSDDFSQISDNLSHTTVKTPTKETESIISQEDKVDNKTGRENLKEESYSFGEKPDYEPHFPKIELNLEIQSNWTKGFEDSINNTLQGNDFIQNNENIRQEAIIADI